MKCSSSTKGCAWTGRLADLQVRCCLEEDYYMMYLKHGTMVTGWVTVSLSRLIHFGHFCHFGPYFLIALFQFNSKMLVTGLDFELPPCLKELLLICGFQTNKIKVWKMLTNGFENVKKIISKIVMIFLIFLTIVHYFLTGWGKKFSWIEWTIILCIKHFAGL